MSATTTLVTGVDFISLPTQDLDAASAFYMDVLGLERSSVWQRGDTPAMGAEFEAGDTTIALLVSANLGIEFQPNKVPLALHVDDFEAAKTELESRGVTFQGDTIDSGVCHMAPFADPDGNALMLHNRYAPHAPRG